MNFNMHKMSNKANEVSKTETRSRDKIHKAYLPIAQTLFPQSLKRYPYFFKKKRKFMSRQ